MKCLARIGQHRSPEYAVVLLRLLFSPLFFLGDNPFFPFVLGGGFASAFYFLSFLHVYFYIFVGLGRKNLGARARAVANCPCIAWRTLVLLADAHCGCWRQRLQTKLIACPLFIVSHVRSVEGLVVVSICLVPLRGCFALELCE
ncbi:hypothetical protein B0T17DRAFT_228506 [Bombardia bombarda]|uniref:Uncharacterized protein n=1 Tax=Bombardia bombarda TaxID=252184 RepID=A0AA39XBJ9_9PEZI|nr:hypothetical protein B0T17DRAFT_228506 [Bombardia bombarda]